jgi:peptidoglycan/LPS O-acetylase OafA/YrhL
MNSINDKKRIFGLDVMRATAIMMVLLSHLYLIFPSGKGVVAQIISLFGFLGVEIFFVLSGFLIGKILYKMMVIEPEFSRKHVFQFFKRRWYRTLPNYFFVLLVAIFIAVKFEYDLDQLWKYFFFLQNFSQPMLPFFPESWSLSIEEYAYVVLPLFLWVAFILFKPKNKSRMFLMVTIMLLLIFLETKYWYQITTTNTTLLQWNVALKAVVIYRLDAIFMGVLFSWLYYNSSYFWKKFKFFFFLIGSIMLGLLFIGVGFFGILIETHPFFWNVCYLPITSLAFALFLPLLSEWNGASIFIKKPITFISKISYSIYLLHYSVVLQLARYFFNPSEYTTLGLFFYSICYLTVTLVFSWFLYRYFEKPIMDYRGKI